MHPLFKRNVKISYLQSNKNSKRNDCKNSMKNSLCSAMLTSEIEMPNDSNFIPSIYRAPLIDHQACQTRACKSKLIAGNTLSSYTAWMLRLHVRASSRFEFYLSSCAPKMY